ncbi:MAG: hypothetical protein AAF403_08310, partial [Pseudomonadota bacterium]
MSFIKNKKTLAKGTERVFARAQTQALSLILIITMSVSLGAGALSINPNTPDYIIRLRMVVDDFWRPFYHFTSKPVEAVNLFWGELKDVAQIHQVNQDLRHRIIQTDHLQ